MKQAKLIDENGYVVAVFIPNKDYTHAISGTMYEVVSWELNDEPMDVNFFANVSVKWDGCSHFYFYGSDYRKGLVPYVYEEKGNDKEKDGYYHICGFDSYLTHMKIMCFAYELMIRQLGTNSTNGDEYEQLKKLNLLDGCEIKIYD